MCLMIDKWTNDLIEKWRLKINTSKNDIELKQSSMLDETLNFEL